MYFNIDEQEMTKEKVQNISKTNPRFSGKHHTEKSKQAISESQKKRYNTIKRNLSQGLTEEDVSRICKQTIDKYLGNHALLFKSNNNINIPL